MRVTYFPKTANGKLDRKALPDPDTDPDEAVMAEEVIEESEKKEGATADTVFTGSGFDDVGDLDGGASMVTHVCDIIESLRGYRPSPQSSFGSIGVDSLGAVMFIRHLSDSLDGVRIAPSMLYGEGVTVASFAERMFERLHVENPGVLERLHIVCGWRSGMKDEEVGGAGGVVSGRDIEDLILGSEPNADANGLIPQGLETFEDRILANRAVLEGLRGAFMLIVLFDHQRGRNPRFVLLADTLMFIIISGFTTGLQHRPMRDMADSKVAERLVPRPWDWKSFLTSRAIGLFPVLWLALLFNAPRWSKHDVVSSSVYNTTMFSAGEKATCAVLYTVGQQGWVRPLCRQLGPNNVLYASQIWNCFLIYSLVRVVVDYVQRRIRRSFFEAETLAVATEAMSDIKKTVFRMVIDIGDNRPKGALCVAVVGVWVFFLQMWFHMGLLLRKVGFGLCSKGHCQVRFMRRFTLHLISF